MGKTKQHKNEYARYLRTELDIRYLSQKYRKAHEWIPRLALEAPGLKPEEALKKIRERLTKLRDTRKRMQESRLSNLKRAPKEPDLRRSVAVRAMPHREMSYMSSASSPRSIELAIPRPVEQRVYTLETALQRFVERPVTNRVDGIARASGFKQYRWMHPDKDTYVRDWIFPIGTDYSGDDPYDFVGATGLNFVAEIEVQPTLLTDPVDFCGFGGILQYSLPEAPWDCVLQWFLCQKFEIPGINCSADYGYFSLTSIARQCPSWEDFPADDAFVEFSGLDLPLLPIIEVSGEEFSTMRLIVTDTFESGHWVTRRAKPCIYVGFSIVMGAIDGSTSVGIPSMAHHYMPDTGPGLRYAFVRM